MKRSAAATVRKRVEDAGERYWTHRDFTGLSPQAAQQALWRMSEEGSLQKVRKGVYYHSRPTVFGTTVPSSSDIATLSTRAPVHPSGLLAANVLGLSTQNPLRPEFATVGHNPPSALAAIGRVHTGRAKTRAQLSREEGAFLEVLRERGRFSDLDEAATRSRLLRFLSEPGRLERLAQAALDEPPRVRAMLGALAEEMGTKPEILSPLRDSLNPLTRFDFGVLADLPTARTWQAE